MASLKLGVAYCRGMTPSSRTASPMTGGLPSVDGTPLVAGFGLVLYGP